ncbi:hypothetical protein HaLaN_01144, partial [Haematococcus lacustris]
MAAPSPDDPNALGSDGLMVRTTTQTFGGKESTVAQVYNQVKGFTTRASHRQLSPVIRISSMTLVVIARAVAKSSSWSMTGVAWLGSCKQGSNGVEQQPPRRLDVHTPVPCPLSMANGRVDQLLQQDNIRNTTGFGSLEDYIASGFFSAQDKWLTYPRLVARRFFKTKSLQGMKGIAGSEPALLIHPGRSWRVAEQGAEAGPGAESMCGGASGAGSPEQLVVLRANAGP